MNVTIEKIEFPSQSKKSSAETVDEVNTTMKTYQTTIETAYEDHLLEDGKGSATIASYTGDIRQTVPVT